MTDASTINSASAVTEESVADRTLIIERVFKASPDKVFKAWTDPAILVKWWGPEGVTTPQCQMDVRNGGGWRTTMHMNSGENHTVSGVYREISPPDHLVMTWGWEEDGQRGHETVIDIKFEPVSDGTRMRFVQSVFQSTEMRDRHQGGWDSSFKDLARVFE